MLEAVPFAAAQPLTHELISSLKKNAPGNWSARRGPVTVQLILTATAQALIVSLDGTIGVPSEWLDDELAEQISHHQPHRSDDRAEHGQRRPAGVGDGPRLKAIVAQSYFNAPGIDVRKGIQLVARASVGGYLGSTISTGLGVPVQGSILSVGKGAGLPTLPSQIVGGSNASTATGLGDAIRLMAKQAYDRKVEKQLKARGEEAARLLRAVPDCARHRHHRPDGHEPGDPARRDRLRQQQRLGRLQGATSTSALPGKTFVGFLGAPYAARLIRITEFKVRPGLARPDPGRRGACRCPSGREHPVRAGPAAPERHQRRSVLAEAPLSVIKLANPLPGGRAVPVGRCHLPFPPAAHFNLMLLGPSPPETLGRLVKALPEGRGPCHGAGQAGGRPPPSRSTKAA